MQKPLPLTINLAKNRGENFWDHFIEWALTIGRVVIIITELIALGAFLYRFSLDQRLVNLHDHIAQEQAIVNLLKSNETTFRNLQDRLALAKAVMDQSANTNKTFSDVIQLIPPSMQVSTFLMTQDNIKIDGSLASIAVLRDFVDKIKAYPQVTSVSVDKIQTNTSSATIGITITATLKKPKSNFLL
ncbi:MAG TPA: hypothetical protein VFQ63_00790 [Patescibacteria group bacterium]|nr:hypothetical protein [Patescibacteria group bacterium]